MMRIQQVLWGALVGVIGLLGLGKLISSSAQVLYPPIPMAHTTQVNLEMGSSLSLHCPQSVAMPEIFGIGDARADFLCEVSQMTGRGYVIDVAGMTDLVKGGVGSPTDKQKFVPDAGKMGMIKTGAWAISTDNGMNWYTTGGRLVTVNNRTSTNDQVRFTLGVHAGADDGLTAWMESGDYSGSLVLTATALL